VLWDCLVALLPEGRNIRWNFPMRHVANAVEEVLVELAFDADWDEATSASNWVSALTKLRFSDHMRAISVNL
jgi:hypothetical protein